MESDILKDHDLKHSAEDIFGSINQRSQLIFIILLVFLSFTVILMGIIRVPVFIESKGMLRPSSEKKQIYSPITGTIKEILIAENQKVSENQIIIIVNTEEEKTQLKLLKLELHRTRGWMNDCFILINDDPPACDSLHTLKYRAEYILALNERQILEMEITQAETDISRYRPLEKDTLISKKEMEDLELRHSNLEGKLKSKISSDLNHWLEQFDHFRQQESSLLKEIFRLENLIEKAEIRAPVSGTIQGIRTVYPGYFCPAGKYLCDLIPDSGLIVEMYIPSGKIGFIKPGMKTRFKIDAFDYKYWGFLYGTCLSISKDYEIIENLPFFRVTCKPEQPYQLKYNNKTVFPGPGMSVTAQFFLINRTIWQLIRDKMYNWIGEQE